MNQRELSVTEQVNIKSSDLTEAQLKEMILERKKLTESIKKSEEEFAKVVLKLPGSFKLVTTTAIDRSTTFIHKASRFFKRITEKAVRFDIYGLFHTSWKEMQDVKEMVCGLVTGAC